MGLTFEKNCIKQVDVKGTFGNLEFLDFEEKFVYDSESKSYTTTVDEIVVMLYSSQIKDNVEISVPADFDLSKFEYEDKVELLEHVTATVWQNNYSTTGRDGKEIWRSEQAYKIRAAGIKKVGAEAKTSEKNKPEGVGK
ncbi:DUF961 family protein [Enterococcus sp. LJL128]